jgi:hypothetical protein
MIRVLGDTLSTGKYSFHGGIGWEASDEDDLANIDDDRVSNIDPRLRSQTASQAGSVQLSQAGSPITPGPSTPAAFDDDDEPETRAKKRHRESNALTSTAKKAKVSGLGIMERMTEGIMALADAVKADSSVSESMSSIQKETVESTLSGQAVTRIQEESSLMEDGMLVMMDLLSDSTLARTYMAIRSESLRAKWIKKQLEKQGADMEECFADWPADKE